LEHLGETVMKRNAVIDSTGLYRYSLGREWEPNSPSLAFVMLNPSLADAIADDPTLRRCINFAQSWGYGSLEVVNLFAYRASCPTVLKRIKDPIGPENDRYLKQAVELADKIIVAWGNQGILENRAKVVLHWLNSFATLYCLGITQTGSPRHPLYVKGNTKPAYYLS
jgi:hypothetical protein